MNDSLAKRPLGIIKNFCEESNIDYSFKDNILTLGHINEFKDIIEIDASVSSQLISGLLFVLPILDKEQTIIKLQNEIVSLNYILMTLKTLSDFGISVNFNGKELIIPGRQKYISTNYIVEGDYSSASSFIVYALNKNVISGYKQVVEKGGTNSALNDDIVVSKTIEESKKYALTDSAPQQKVTQNYTNRDYSNVDLSAIFGNLQEIEL